MHGLSLFSFIQALTTLDLSSNQIGAQGAQYLGEGLKHNTVRSSLLLVLCMVSVFSLLIQTLTTLDLQSNKIGDQGAQYLGEGLQHNTVRSSLLLVLCIVSVFSLSYRHSLHSTLAAMKSEIKVHNIWSAWKIEIAESKWMFLSGGYCLVLRLVDGTRQNSDQVFCKNSVIFVYSML